MLAHFGKSNTFLIYWVKKSISLLRNTCTRRVLKLIKENNVSFLSPLKLAYALYFSIISFQCQAPLTGAIFIATLSLINFFAEAVDQKKKGRNYTLSNLFRVAIPWVPEAISHSRVADTVARRAQRARCSESADTRGDLHLEKKKENEQHREQCSQPWKKKPAGSSENKAFETCWSSVRHTMSLLAEQRISGDSVMSPQKLESIEVPLIIELLQLCL